MLFNSYIFIFVFLPIVICVFYILGNKGHHRVAISWLVASSFFFYGWWNPIYIILLLSSILFNYTFGILLTSNDVRWSKSWVLIVGIIANVSLLGYFKYANFFVENINAFFGTGLILETIILPLAISFFTFQQIAYLVDASRGDTHEYSFLHYCLFVTFFPQLIAGPIVHHRETIPQFESEETYKFKYSNITIGLAIFSLGLFKKIIIADGMATYANPVFDAAETGVTISFFEAWSASIAYAFQLYFDFSGYSDMAIGIARMFGILLPINFNSPFKARDIIDFWRRWHITLTRFITSYIFTPLSMPLMRFALTRKLGLWSQFWLSVAIPVMIAFVIAGFWHGAGWTFILFGVIHGIYLVINYSWLQIKKNIFNSKTNDNSILWKFIGRGITIFAILFSFVIFRAESLEGANEVLQGMLGLNGFILPDRYLLKLNSIANLGDHLHNIGWLFVPNGILGFTGTMQIFYSLVLFVIVVYAPNTQQIMLKFKPFFENKDIEIKPIKLKFLEWKPTRLYGFVFGIFMAICVLKLGEVSEFIYFQF